MLFFNGSNIPLIFSQNCCQFIITFLCKSLAYYITKHEKIQAFD